MGVDLTCPICISDLVLQLLQGFEPLAVSGTALESAGISFTYCESGRRRTHLPTSSWQGPRGERTHSPLASAVSMPIDGIANPEWVRLG